MKKKILLKQIKIDLLIFCTEILVIISPDIPHVIRAIEHHQHQKIDPSRFDGADGISVFGPKEIPVSPILWMPFISPNSAKSISVLSHEATHMAKWIFRHCEIDECKETEEIFCLIVGIIVRKTLEGLH